MLLVIFVIAYYLKRNNLKDLVKRFHVAIDATNKAYMVLVLIKY